MNQDMDNSIVTSRSNRRQRGRKRKHQQTNTSSVGDTNCNDHDVPLLVQNSAAIATSDAQYPSSCIATGETALSMKEKGRYKKLMKRAIYKANGNRADDDVSGSTCNNINDKNNANNTGICVLSDWIELQQLHEKYYRSKLQKDGQHERKEPQLPGIQIIQHARYCSPTSTPSCDASFHRSLLLQLIKVIEWKQLRASSNNNEQICSGSDSNSNIVDILTNEEINDEDAVASNNNKTSTFKSKKAKANPTSSYNFLNNNSKSKIQGISIHNCLALSHIAIIEIHLQSIDEASMFIQSIMDMEQHLPSLSSTISNNTTDGNATCNIHVAVIPTQWFHANETESQSITDALMYQNSTNVTTTSADAARGKRKQRTITTTMVELKNIPHTQQVGDVRDKSASINNGTECSSIKHTNSTIASDHNNNKCIMSDTIKQLESYILSLQQLKNECYPLPGHGNVDINTSGILSFDQKCQILDLSVAQSFVLPYQQRPFLNKCDDFEQSNSKYIPEARDFELAPFVGHIFNPTAVDTTSSVSGQSLQQRPRRIFCIDCEMVETNHICRELARVTICEMISCSVAMEADSDSVAIKIVTHLDAIVQPRNNITNYLTKYSGISASSYKDTDNHNASIVRIEQVQAFVLQLINPNDIVIGHSLENDLHALRFIHPTVIDTAIMFQGTRLREQSTSLSSSFKYSLRHLAAVLLRKHIQKADESHCSQEDAVTALELAVNRAIIGPSFCVAKHMRNNTNWLVNLSQQQQNNKLSFPAVCVGPIKWLQQHILSPRSANAIHALQCESVDDSNSKAIVSWLTGPKRRACIVWSKLHRKLRSIPTAANSKESSSETFSGNEIIDWLKNVIVKLFSSNNSTVLIVPIQINYDAAHQLHGQRRIRRDNPRSSIPWSDNDEKQFQLLLETSRNGYVLYITSKV